MKRCSAEELLNLNIDFGILNVYLENLISHLIGSGILNVLQIFSVLHCIICLQYRTAYKNDHHAEWKFRISSTSSTDLAGCHL